MTADDIDQVALPPGFEAVRRLGSGGMGTVYLARQLSLNRLVALKILPPLPRRESAARAARFRREAELMAQVTHPNVVAIHDFGIDGDRPYLVMEYVEGGDLRRKIEPGRPLDPARVRALIGPIARALAGLHRGGILHRDLKPGNILMRDDLTPKVADFGIATLAASGDDPSWPAPAGTPDYVAPEQRYGLKVDERCDQYSLAAVAYELLTGRRPLGSFAPPSRHHPGLAREADEAIGRALSEDRDDRFATVEEFARALDQALSDSRARRRDMRPVWAAAIVATLGAVGAVFLARPGQEAAAPPAHSAGAPTEARTVASTTPPPPPSKPPEPLPRTFTNSLGMKMLLLMPGEFLMGSPATDADAQPDERPQHPARITRPFYLAECEVTIRQFRAFAERTGYKTEAEREGRGGLVFDVKAKEMVSDPRWTFRNPGPGRVPGDDEPVVQVSWGDAKALCDWLSREEKLPYRLPTEAEWEFACRAGTTTRWSTGDDPSTIDDAAWTRRNAESRLRPVGQKAANPWGLRDMHGNAWEWCEDWVGPYEPGPAIDPAGPERGRKKVLRGGSWDWEGAVRTRSASRIADPPDRPHFTHGFRVAIGAPARAVEGRGAP